MNPEVLNLYLNVAGDYQRFIGELRAKLADHPQQLNYIAQYGDWLREHPLLPMQLAKQPARWIHINLIVQDEDGVETKRTTIALRDDNVYFMGFKNRNGHWYEFGIQGQSKHFITESRYFLGCDGSYRSLLDGQDLSTINLGMAHAISAVDALWYHVGAANAATKRHLACLCVMICESARMRPHYERVGGGWNVGDTIDPLHVRYANKWAQMSRALINQGGRYPENLDRQGTLDVVELILNSRLLGGNVEQQRRQQQEKPTPRGGGGSSQQGSGSSDPQRPETASWPPASGSGSGGRLAQEQPGQTGGKSVRTQPLVQVFEVKAELPDVIGSIVVFDGKRGQIIYNHGSMKRGDYGLALTGPYKAISADGSFAIQVHGITSRTDASDESTEVIGEMLWDCYAKNVEYDKISTGEIIGSETSTHPLTTVRYAVLSEAVEATMEVNLLIPGSTGVYGHISAQYPSLGYEGVVLFRRNEEDKVELVPSDADSMAPLELGRSVIAVPLQSRYSWIEILVLLRVAHPNKEGDVILAGRVDFYLDKHTGEIRVQPDAGDITVPGGWTGGSDSAGGIGASRGSKGASGSESGQGAGQTIVQQGKVQVNITSPGFHISPLEPESREHMGLDTPRKD